MKDKKFEKLWTDLKNWSDNSIRDNTIKSYGKLVKKYLSEYKVIDFYWVSDTLYALSLVDEIIVDIQTKIKKATKEKEQLQNTCSALRYLQKFLQKKSIRCRIDHDDVQDQNLDESLDEKRNKIAKSSLHKIDGIESIIKALGSEDEFIKLAVKSSYFFSEEVVIKRHGEMKSEIDKGKDGKLPARKGKNEYTKISVEIDDDGNKAVRKLINDETGYTIGQGKDSIFQNYNLSHVWGNAYDPRYFTSLWNIVVIPSWANHLMDKEAPEQGSIASKMINTYKKICETLYFKDIELKEIDLDKIDREKDGGVEVEYINIIKLKGENKVGSIVQKEIIISTK
ncbi:MAG: hypothetical protein J5588_00625 [Bacteroidales bacterium]|nr:hypothetical protein [Bacteroidales bacterium]